MRNIRARILSLFEFVQGGENSESEKELEIDNYNTDNQPSTKETYYNISNNFVYVKSLSIGQRMMMNNNNNNNSSKYLILKGVTELEEYLKYVCVLTC
ncbi:hypothetical protein C0J52_03371 [Blattella germanica]|nr:hypothetical protein C0J52_03371 [Blattella germanica]